MGGDLVSSHLGIKQYINDIMDSTVYVNETSTS